MVRRILVALLLAWFGPIEGAHIALILERTRRHW